MLLVPENHTRNPFYLENLLALPMLPVEQSSQLRARLSCTADEEPNRFYPYGVVGQLAALAASDELVAAQAEAPSALEFA